jgi:WD40 repeat protein
MWQACVLASAALFGGDTPATLPAGALRQLGNGAFYTRVEPAAVAVSPDGRRVAAGEAYEVRIWDAVTGRLWRDLEGVEGHVVAVAFSPDGRTLASVDHPMPTCGRLHLGPKVVDGPTVRLWDVESGAELRRTRCKARFPATLAFSPDGKLLAGPNDAGGVSVWDVATGDERQRLACRGFGFGVAFAQDGRDLACTQDDDAIHFVDLATGQEKHRTASGFEHVRRFVLTPDGRTAVVTNDKRAIRVLDVESSEARSLGETITRPAFPVAFSPDGATLALATAAPAIEVWQRSPERRLLSIAVGKDSLPPSLAFSNDGKTLAFPGDDGVRVFDVATGKERFPRTARRSALASVAFSPDGKTVLATERFGANAHVWNAATGAEVATLRDRLWPWAIAPDGRHLASRGKAQYSLDLWDLAAPSAPAPFSDLPGDPCALAFSPDGLTLASTSADGVVRVFDVETRTIRGRAALNSPWKAPIAFSPDGRFLAVPDSERVVAALDATTGGVARRFSGAVDGVQAIAWSPDGERFAAVDAAGSATTWRARTASLDRHWLAHDGPAGSVAFAPDGRTLATSGRDGIVVWDVASGERLARFPGGDEWPACVAFSPDGRVLAAGDDDGTVTLWPAPARR